MIKEKPKGTSLALGKSIETSSFYEQAKALNIRFNAKAASEDTNLSTVLLAAAGIEQFLSSKSRSMPSDDALKRIEEEVHGYCPHLSKERINHQSVTDNDIFRLVQALTTSVGPVLQCSEAEITRRKSVDSDIASPGAMRQSKTLSNNVMDAAHEMHDKIKLSTSGDQLSSLGIILSSITTICTNSDLFEVPKSVLMISLLNMINEIATEELAKNNPLNRFAEIASKRINSKEN